MNMRRNPKNQVDSEQSRARRASTIEGDRSGPGQALRKARAYLALNARVQALIPDTARGRIAIACVEDDCLVIAASSSASASQARLLADSLLEAACHHWPERLTRTRVIVMPELNMEASKPD